jgi:hypothetical protein
VGGIPIARDPDDADCLKHRSDAIAGKPTPTLRHDINVGFWPIAACCEGQQSTVDSNRREPTQAAP